MSEFDNKRSYKVEKIQLDPLSEWFYSRRTFGTYQGTTLSEPDPALVEQVIPGSISTVQTYTISGPPAVADFIRSCASENQNQEYNRSVYEGSDGRTSQYSYISPLTNREGETLYSNFAQKILRNLLNTANKVFILNQDEDPLGLRSRTYSIFNGRVVNSQFRLSGADAFQNRLDTEGDHLVPMQLSAGGETLDTNLQAFFERAFTGRLPSTSGTETLSIYDVVYGVIRDLNSERISVGEKRIEVLNIAKFLMLKALLNTGIISESQINSLMEIPQYSFEYIDVNASTPFVRNSLNSRFLSTLPVLLPSDNPANLRSHYNFYDEPYEDNLDNEEITEKVLPNLYVRGYFQRGSSADVDDLNRFESTIQRERLEAYKGLLTLTFDEQQRENLRPEYYDSLETSIEAGSTANFYSIYSQLLSDDTSLYSLADADLTDKNSRFIIGQEQMRSNGLPANDPAFAIGVTFSRDRSNTDFSRYLDTQSNSDASVVLLENIAVDQFPFEESYFYSTEILAGETQRKSPRVPVNLKAFDIGANESYIFDTLPRPNDFTSTVLMDKAQNPTLREMQAAKTFVLGNARRRISRNYSTIVNASGTPSEVLGYKITKKAVENNEIMQEIYIGNAGSARPTYMDTQVKYGKEYTYTLSEYRFVYGASFEAFTISTDIRTSIVMAYLGLISLDQTLQVRNIFDRSFSFKNMGKIDSNVRLLEIPVYDERWNQENVFAPQLEGEEGQIDPLYRALNAASTNNLGSGGISYSKAKILDLPPTPPTIRFYPRANIDNKIDVNVNPVSGKIGTIIAEDGSFDERLKIVSIGDNQEKIDEIIEYQRLSSEIPPPEGFVNCKFKGSKQIRNIILYRTTDLNLNVQNQEDLYPSFDPNVNRGVLVRKFTEKANQDSEFTRILSYDLRDTIEPNINYFYCCVVEDVHGNISNPSTIYRIRLLSENGLVIPEVSVVRPSGTDQRVSQKNLSRYLKVEASNIQSFPYTSNVDDELVNDRSLGNALELPIENQSYVLRLTSKDTGRKFDLKLNFIVRVNGVPIGG